MKRLLCIFLAALGAVVIIATVVLVTVLSPEQYSKDSPPPVTSDTDETPPAETLPSVTSDTDETTPAETTEAAIKLTFPEVLAAEIYDPEELYAEGAVWAERFYPDCEIVSFTFLRSIRTGYSAYVALDLVDDSGQYVYFVYDGEKNDIAVIYEGATTSHGPYGHFEDDPDEYPALSERIRTTDPDEVYYFYYPPLSFACGILNSDGTVDVYRLNGYDGTYITITTFEAP